MSRSNSNGAAWKVGVALVLIVAVSEQAHYMPLGLNVLIALVGVGLIAQAFGADGLGKFRHGVVTTAAAISLVFHMPVGNNEQCAQFSCSCAQVSVFSGVESRSSDTGTRN